MTEDPKKFAELLTKAIWNIKASTGKSIGIIEDELGYALHRDGGASIQHWRKGHLPPKFSERLDLTKVLVEQGGFSEREVLKQFLLSADHPNPEPMVNELLPIFSEDGERVVGDETMTKPRAQFDAQFLETPGGAVNLRSKFYIERDADNGLKSQLMRPGELTTILASRQTGKTSLLIRGIHYARQSNVRIVHCDLQRFNANDLTSPDQFLRTLAIFIFDKLRLDRTKVENGWQDPHRSPNDKLTYLLEDHVLLSENDSQIILAIDEADRLHGTYFSEDFFGLIRAWYNHKAIYEQWFNLNIVLVVSTEPYLLIRDLNQSPFNVGLKISLNDFDEEQIRDLNQRYGSPVKEKEFSHFMTKLNGHPYLSRMAFYTLVTENLTWVRLSKIATSDQSPFAEHLQHHHRLILDNPELKVVLKEIIRRNPCSNEAALLRLKRAGLVKPVNNTYMCRCELYKEYFKDKL